MGHGLRPGAWWRASRARSSRCAGKRVAIPGPLTTAALLLRIECPECDAGRGDVRPHPRTRCSRGEVEAGVIIHESQLTYRDEGLVEGARLRRAVAGARRAAGAARARRGAPRPGARADARGERGLPRQHPGGARPRGRGDRATRCSSGAGSTPAQGRKFVHMYVNDLTLDMGEPGRRALARLYERARCGRRDREGAGARGDLRGLPRETVSSGRPGGSPPGRARSGLARGGGRPIVNAASEPAPCTPPAAALRASAAAPRARVPRHPIDVR